MATAPQEIREHDVVELKVGVGHWPATTIGAVIYERGPWKLVEIADHEGQMLDMLEVPESRLKLVEKHS